MVELETNQFSSKCVGLYIDTQTHRMWVKPKHVLMLTSFPSHPSVLNSCGEEEEPYQKGNLIQREE